MNPPLHLVCIQKLLALNDLSAVEAERMSIRWAEKFFFFTFRPVIKDCTCGLQHSEQLILPGRTLVLQVMLTVVSLVYWQNDNFVTAVEIHLIPILKI